MDIQPLSTELTDALHKSGGGPLAVIDPTTQQLYVVVDRNVHERAMRALRDQETIDSIQRGIDGPSLTLEESRRLNLQAIKAFATRQ